MADFSKELQVAILTAKSAGNLLMGYYSLINHKVEWKSRIEYRTEADSASDAFIKTILAKHYPNDTVCSEETEKSVGNPHRIWYVDPIDGTVNFTRKTGVFCVSISLVVDLNPVIGVIFDPLHQELYYAEVNKGAKLNGHSIYVSKETNLGHTFNSISNGKSERKRIIQFMDKLQADDGPGTNRDFGSAAITLCYLARGGIDASVLVGLEPWDLCAGALIAKEAGSKNTNLEGVDWNASHQSIISANPTLHGTILNFLGL